MVRKAKAIALDSWSVLAYLGGDDAGQSIADLLVESQQSGREVLIASTSMGEIWGVLARQVSETDADRAIRELGQLGIEIIDVTFAMARSAAQMQLTSRLSYTSCLDAALAKERKVELVTGDKHFGSLQNEIRIRWI